MLTYFRDYPIPDSKINISRMNTHKMSAVADLLPANRPLSSSSNSSDVNGGLSPQSTLNGRSPSPSTAAALMNTPPGDQLPPACGARQLSKLKRFLTTLQQFGSDISIEIGERVRSLVLGLVNSHISIEEFHSKLQEATHFPLRPFVIPFLKANLPLLQRELFHCASLAKQSPQQFLMQNEHIMLNPTFSPLEMHEAFMSEINENGKRRSPDRPKDKGLDPHMESTNPAKRLRGSQHMSPVPSSRVSPGSSFGITPVGHARHDDVSNSRDMRDRERQDRDQVIDRERTEKDRERHYSGYNLRPVESFEHFERFEDEWRHVEAMLNCIIGMVDKTKRAISVLQERSLREKEENSLWSRRRVDALDSDVKKHTGDMMAYAFRQTDDRMNDVRRRAEEVVKDMRRQAMLELQRAVSAADQKAVDVVTAERMKMDRAVADARKQAHSDLLHSLSFQEESVESCWNCGRKASETCSGCNTARYCGSFCQHKDWDHHHHVCGKAHVASAGQIRGMKKAAVPSAAVATSLTLGSEVKEISSFKDSLLLDAVAISCMSPAPSMLSSCIAAREDTLAAPLAEAAVISSSRSSTGSSSSPRTLSPANSNPDIPLVDTESTLIASSAGETASAQYCHTSNS